MDDLPDDPCGPHSLMAAHHRELFDAYRRAGFQPDQALYLVATHGSPFGVPDADPDD